MRITADIDFLDIMELSQDPISQLSTPGTSTDDTEISNRQPITKIKIKINHRKGFERIDLREYRMPKLPHASPRTKRRPQRTASYSDGFEIKEALPTGRLMPTKQHSRRKATTQKYTVHIGELTIVAEKESGGSTPERRERRQTGHQRRNKKNQSRSSAQEALRGEDPMPIDGDHQQAADESFVQPREEVPSVGPGACTPKITTADNSTFELPTDSSSSLKRKAQSASQTALSEEVDSKQSQNVAPPPRVLLIHNESGEETVFQQLKQVVAKKRTPKRSNLSGLEVSQQLIMVSIRKPPRQMREDSDGSGGSDSGRPREGDTFSSDDSEENNVSEVEEEIEDEVEVEGNNLILEEEADQGGRVETNGVLQGKEDNGVMPKKEPCQPSQEEKSDSVQNDEEEEEEEEEEEDLTQKCEVDSGSLRATAIQVLGHLQGLGLMTPQVGVQDEDEKDSWRPRKPLQSSIVMEVDEGIVDEPSPAGTNFRTPSNRISRGMSRMGSRSLTIIRSRRSSAQIQSPPAAMDDTQGSIELRDPQRVVRSFSSDEVPETQFQPENNSEPETPESQKSFVLDESSQLGSYFGQASQQLKKLVKNLNHSRTKSTPARMHYGPREEMAGGINIPEAFNHTVSSSRAPGEPDAESLRGEGQPRRA